MDNLMKANLLGWHSPILLVLPFSIQVIQARLQTLGYPLPFSMQVIQARLQTSGYPLPFSMQVIQARLQTLGYPLPFSEQVIQARLQTSQQPLVDIRKNYLFCILSFALAWGFKIKCALT